MTTPWFREGKVMSHANLVTGTGKQILIEEFLLQISFYLPLELGKVIKGSSAAISS